MEGGRVAVACSVAPDAPERVATAGASEHLSSKEPPCPSSRQVPTGSTCVFDEPVQSEAAYTFSERPSAVHDAIAEPLGLRPRHCPCGWVAVWHVFEQFASEQWVCENDPVGCGPGGVGPGPTEEQSEAFVTKVPWQYCF